MNTVICSKSELLRKVASELTTSVGYESFTVGKLVRILISLAVVFICILLCYSFYCSETKKRNQVTLYTFYLGMAMPVLIALVVIYDFCKVSTNNNKLGLNHKLIESCITDKRESVVLEIETGAELVEYKSHRDISGLVETEEGTKAISLRLSNTVFIEDTREYLVVPITTYRLNSNKIEALITHELCSEIDQSASYGYVEEIHYNPNKSLKKDKEKGNEKDNSITLKNVQVKVSTDVIVK